MEIALRAMNADCPLPSDLLRGPTVVLRPWTAEDAQWYVSARDEQVFLWTYESRALTVEATRQAIVQNNARPQWVGLAVTDAASGALLGNFALNPAGLPSSEGEVSYWLASAGRGRGAATEAVRLLVAWAFASGRFERIILHTMPGNERSQAVARRCGFTLVHADESRHRFALEKPRADQPEAGGEEASAHADRSADHSV